MYVSENSHRTSSSSKSRDYLNYMDQFRGISIILIVLTHVYPFQFLPFWGWNVVQNASVFFIFISGFFTHHLYREEEPVGAFFQRKGVRILLPYFLSCLPGIFLVWLNSPESIDASFIVWTIITGVGHYNDAHWYAPFILLILLSYPIWRYLIQHNETLIPATCFYMIVSLFTFRSEGNANPLISFIHFFGVFMLGMSASLCSQSLYRILRQHCWTVVVLGFAAWAIIMPFVGLSQSMSMEKMLSSGRLNIDLTLLAKLFLILPLLAIFLRLSDSARSSMLLKLFSQMSFGIFFWHFYSIYLVDQIGAFLELNNAYWWIIFRPLIVIGLVMCFLMFIGQIFPRLSLYFTSPQRK